MSRPQKVRPGNLTFWGRLTILNDVDLYFYTGNLIIFYLLKYHIQKDQQLEL